MNHRHLFNKHHNKTICIVGGMESAIADDLSRIKADIYISANYHGCKHFTPDYFICLDERRFDTGQLNYDLCKAISRAPVISPYKKHDYHLTRWPSYPVLGLSGATAIWLAYHMGAKAIILAGMDAYGGKHKNRYVKAAKGVDVPIRCATNGALQQVFKPYDSAEHFDDVEPVPVTHGELVDCVFAKGAKINNVFYDKGYTGNFCVDDIRLLLKHRTMLCLNQ